MSDEPSRFGTSSTDKSEKSDITWKDAITIVVSLTSLAISLFTAYYTTLSKRYDLSFGTAGNSGTSYKLEPPPRLVSIDGSYSLVFLNSGNQTYAVLDAQLVFGGTVSNDRDVKCIPATDYSAPMLRFKPEKAFEAFIVEPGKIKTVPLKTFACLEFRVAAAGRPVKVVDRLTEMERTPGANEPNQTSFQKGELIPLSN